MRYEYYMVEGQIDQSVDFITAILNSLGQRRWKLVAVTPLDMVTGRFKYVFIRGMPAKHSTGSTID